MKCIFYARTQRTKSVCVLSLGKKAPRLTISFSPHLSFNVYTAIILNNLCLPNLISSNFSSPRMVTFSFLLEIMKWNERIRPLFLCQRNVNGTTRELILSLYRGWHRQEHEISLKSN